MSTQTSSPPKANSCLRATIWIWGFSALSMFACIPILALTQEGVLLPLSIVFAAASSTVTIWMRAHHNESLHQNQLQQLQQRLEVLESIACREGLEAVKH
ncbi:hypothetical protein [Leptolyngbya sp. FACHB-711]|uniref:hypothetical protein n=1 Tax=Leptolyngbya sp. FACHB-711 TaxID=2692813 RepID=UPI0016836C53|nr:hypothetical protein [Leptolyngbya sp. FACHB-711]MBD2028235.1 hypothetical protein [Leptolyngbya sp. FACHB-711]